MGAPNEQPLAIARSIEFGLRCRFDKLRHFYVERDLLQDRPEEMSSSVLD